MTFSWKRSEYHPTKFIRVVQIVLLILIIIGIGLLCTQKMWVPKLVDAIMASENTK